MKWRPYPKYKPSGVEWLGDVPEHWAVKRAGLAFQIQLGKMLQPNAIGENDIEVPYFKALHVQWEHVHTRNLPMMWASPSDRYKYSINDGDLLVCEGGEVGRAGIVSEPPNDSIIQNALHRVRARRKNNVRLLMYVLEHAASQDWFSILCNRSTIAHFTGEKFSSLRVPLPPSSEQTAMADFLDRETGRIDTLVAKKQTLIERLKEKRTALISRTVTRGLPPDEARKAGLDPHPRLKPSGVEWLGDVPEGWGVKRLKWGVTFQRGHDLPADARQDGTVPLVTSSGVSATHSYAIAKGPGIVTGRYGTIGQFYLIEEDFWPLNTTLYSIDLRGNDPRFLVAMLIHISPLFMLNAVKSAVPGVDRNDIHNVTIVVPPIVEQQAMADFLDRETAKIDQLIAKIETAIERLREYRTTLITAAVTGKIDVREGAKTMIERGQS